MDLAGVKTFVVVSMFIWIHSRFRYDQIMRLERSSSRHPGLALIVSAWMQTPWNRHLEL